LAWLQDWWSGLSGESKAAIIAAIVGPFVAAILGLRVRMIRWIYIRTLEKLDRAREEIKRESKASLGAIISVNEDKFPISVKEAAKKADVWVWLARQATQWHERTKKYGV
jgi:hypothetical protein